jgi:hypothetical protein
MRRSTQRTGVLPSQKDISHGHGFTSVSSLTDRIVQVKYSGAYGYMPRNRQLDAKVKLLTKVQREMVETNLGRVAQLQQHQTNYCGLVQHCSEARKSIPTVCKQRAWNGN